MAVAVAVPDRAAVDDHRVVKNAVAIAILLGFERLEEPGESLGVEGVDLRDLGQLVRVILVVGDAVVAVGDADLVEGTVAAVVGEEE